MSSSGDQRRSALLALFAAYQTATGLGLSVIGRTFASDKSFHPRLADGRNTPTQRKTDAVVAAFAKDWPANAVWPAEVPRPGV
jgi:hypothetical protein